MLQAMLQRGDQRLVQAFREYQFHRDDAAFIDELQFVRRQSARQGAHAAAFASRIL
jgi:hypothetical protein